MNIQKKHGIVNKKINSLRKTMEKISENPTVMVWHGIWIVKISEVPNSEEFAKWLAGQTLPLVEESDSPTGWAYEGDYSRWINNLPIID